MATGDLYWDDTTRSVSKAASRSPQGPPPKGAGVDSVVLRDVDGDEIEDVAVLSYNEVHVRSGENGKEIWRWKLGSSDGALEVGLSRLLSQQEPGGSVGLAVVGAADGGTGAPYRVALYAANGMVVANGPLPPPVNSSSKFCVSSAALSGEKRGGGGVGGGAAALVCLQEGGFLLHVYGLAEEAAAPMSVEVGALLGQTGENSAELGELLTDPAVTVVSLEPPPAGTAEALVLHLRGSPSTPAAAAVRLPRTLDGAFEPLALLRTFPAAAGGGGGGGWVFAGGVDRGGNEVALRVRLVGSGGVDVEPAATRGELKWPSFGGGGGGGEGVLLTGEEQGPVQAAWAGPYVRRDGGGTALRLAVVTAAGSLALVQADRRVAWVRFEGLASVTQAAFVDLPVPSPPHNELMDSEHMAHTNAVARLVQRTGADLADLVALAVAPAKASGRRGRRLPWDDVGVSEAHDMVGDRFGFRKLVVVLTEHASVAALHSATGRVVWQRYLGAAEGTTRLRQLFLTRAAAPDGALEMQVLGDVEGDTPGAGPFLAELNPLTGSLLGRRRLPAKVLVASLVPVLDSRHRRLLLLLDEQAAVHLLPDSQEARGLVAARWRSLVFYTVAADPASGQAVLRGYGLAPGGLLRAEERWTVALPPGETILALGPHDSEEAVKSAGRVLGNRGVLLKYINVNLLALATITQGSAPVLRVYLIDTVLGAVIHSVVHKDAVGPVHMVQAENMALYSYWNRRRERQEMAVLELFHKTDAHIISAAQMMRFNTTAGGGGGLLAEKPVVASQAYILPQGLKGLGVTTTMRGITPKAILVALASDQVLGLDRRFLDPRRPTAKPTSEDIEEGLIPYAPMLPILPTALLSYNHTVHRVRAIRVAPARIESTCHMVAFGVDIYYTRVTPAKAFDCLGDDFNFATLLASVAFLAAMTWVVVWYQGRRELSAAWK